MCIVISELLYSCLYSDVLSPFRLFHLMRHQLQELPSARLDREIKNEHENVRTFLFYFTNKNGTERIAWISNIVFSRFVRCLSVCLFVECVELSIDNCGRTTNVFA